MLYENPQLTMETEWDEAGTKKQLLFVPLL